MSFIPQEELQGKERLSLAPMIDFLFLMLMFFATLAVSRIAVKNTDIDLVKIRPEENSFPDSFSEKKVITLNISQDGTYQWVTDVRDHPFSTAEEIAHELKNQYQKGLLPQEKSLTYILLRIDKEAMWEPILKLIFAVRDAGFEIHPAYEPETEVALYTENK